MKIKIPGVGLCVLPTTLDYIPYFSGQILEHNAQERGGEIYQRAWDDVMDKVMEQH